VAPLTQMVHKFGISLDPTGSGLTERKKTVSASNATKERQVSSGRNRGTGKSTENPWQRYLTAADRLLEVNLDTSRFTLQRTRRKFE